MKIKFDINKLFEKIKDSYILFYIFYFITLFVDTTTLIVDYPVIVLITKVIRYFTYILFFSRFILILPKILKEFTNIKISKTKVLIISLCVLFFIGLVGNLICTGKTRFIFLFLVLLASYDISYDDIIKRMSKLQMILTIVIVTLSLFGVTQNYIVGRGSISRYSLGFIYTTNLSQMIVFSIVLNAYTNKFKMKNIQLLYIQLINLLVYFITNSRAEFIVLEFIILVCLVNNSNIINKSKELKEKIAKFFCYSYALYPMLSFIIVCMYSVGGVFYKINSLLSNRLSQTYKVLQQYGIKIFGTNIEFIGNGIIDKMKYGSQITSNYVDNEYIQVLFSYGWIFALSFILLLNAVLIYLYKKHEYKKILICFIYLMFGLLNPRIINVLYSPIMFILVHEVISYLKSKNLKSVIEGDIK